MINIMGGNKKTEPFRMYVDNTIRAFLAIRKYRELVINLVELITKSSLGCFNKKSIEVGLFDQVSARKVHGGEERLPGGQADEEIHKPCLQKPQNVHL
jgi:hypothetical protein